MRSTSANREASAGGLSTLGAVPPRHARTAQNRRVEAMRRARTCAGVYEPGRRSSIADMHLHSTRHGALLNVFALWLGLVGAPARGAAIADRSEVAGALAVLDVWLDEQIASGVAPGFSIAIVHDQELVWAKGYGFADLESRRPATPATLYRLGSVTKLFTATAILQLRDQ